MILVYPDNSIQLPPYKIYTLSSSSRQLTHGKATVQVSTEPELLKRALKDITDKYNVDSTVAAPTHLLLFNNIDTKASTNTEV